MNTVFGPAEPRYGDDPDRVSLLRATLRGLSSVADRIVPEEVTRGWFSVLSLTRELIAAEGGELRQPDSSMPLGKPVF